jgi:outer membrane protein assembly factor BamE (lipoprotein component of BamABCDE complex)
MKSMTSPSDSSTRRLLLSGGLALFGASLLAGCTQEIQHRGYYAKSGALSQVGEGMAKSEVEAIMGSPSTTASINFQGDSYYYITSVTQGRAFLDPVEIKREVIAIRFNKEDQVQSLASYALEDGRIIDINTRKTPTPGTEFDLLAELFRGAGRSSAPSGSLIGRKL